MRKFYLTWHKFLTSQKENVKIRRCHIYHLGPWNIYRSDSLEIGTSLFTGVKVGRGQGRPCVGSQLVFIPRLLGHTTHLHQYVEWVIFPGEDGRNYKFTVGRGIPSWVSPLSLYHTQSMNDLLPQHLKVFVGFHNRDGSITHGKLILLFVIYLLIQTNLLPSTRLTKFRVLSLQLRGHPLVFWSDL